MRVKNMLAIGFLSMMAVTGVVTASGSFASDTSQGNAPERIGHGGSTYQLKAARAGDCRSKADVVERIGHGGSTYLPKADQAGDCHLAREMGQSLDVVERIGHGGSTYSSSQTMQN